MKELDMETFINSWEFFVKIITHKYVWELLGFIITAGLAGLFAGWFAKKFSDIKDKEKEESTILKELNLEAYKVLKILVSLNTYCESLEKQVKKGNGNNYLPNIESGSLKYKDLNPNIIYTINKLIQTNHILFKNLNNTKEYTQYCLRISSIIDGLQNEKDSHELDNLLLLVKNLILFLLYYFDSIVLSLEYYNEDMTSIKSTPIIKSLDKFKELKIHGNPYI